MSVPETPWRLWPGEDAWSQLSPEARHTLLFSSRSYSHVPEPVARELSAAGFLVRERGAAGVELAFDPRALLFVRWLEEVRSRALLSPGVSLGARVSRLSPDESSSPGEGALLGLVREARGRVKVAALARLLPRFGRAELDRARERLGQKLVLFHDLDSKTFELEIGLLAPAREALVQEPEPGPLAPLGTTPADVFERPIFQGDVATLLLELARAPAKEKQDSQLYEKSKARFLAALEPVPAWVGALGHLPARRLELALATVRAQAFVQARESELGLTSVGRAHLTSPRATRLATFPGPANPWKVRLDEAFYGVGVSSIVLADPRDRAKYHENGATDRAALREAVARPFAALEVGRFFDLDAFTRDACARGAAPLLRGAEPGRVLATLGMRTIPPERGELERASRQLLRQLVTGPLVHVGGVALAPEPGSPGSFAFALTPLGRVYLGLERELAPEATALPADAILQPNFDIVVFSKTEAGPDPALLAELLLVSELVSGGAGDPARTLKLTRASVRSAVGAGLSAEAILALLARLSKTGVPENVARSVRDWASAVRRAALLAGPFLALPDEETLERVRAALGDEARPPAHVLSVEGWKPAELRRKLEKLGITLD